METQPSMDKHPSALKSLLQRWRNHRNADFRFDSQCEQWAIERMAQDVGMSASELRTVARLGPEAADLLYGRMLVLEIDRSEVARSQPQTLRDMQRVCAHCDCRKQCARDLANDGSNPAWQRYCPNAETLQELSALPWLSRNES